MMVFIPTPQPFRNDQDNTVFYVRYDNGMVIY